MAAQQAICMPLQDRANNQRLPHPGRDPGLCPLRTLHPPEGAEVIGPSIVPEGRLAEAATARSAINMPGRGHGCQGWTCGDGSFTARGLSGQASFIDPKRRTVIASSANWGAGARDPAATAARDAFQAAVQEAVDDGSAAGTGR